MAENRIWIELEDPSKAVENGKPNERERKDFAEEQCRLANRMLVRLGVTTTKFRWMEYRKRYQIVNEAGGFSDLADRGEWFSLDYLGRED